MCRLRYPRGGSDAVLAAEQQVFKNALDLHFLTLFLLLYYVAFYEWYQLEEDLFTQHQIILS